MAFILRAIRNRRWALSSGKGPADVKVEKLTLAPAWRNGFERRQMDRATHLKIWQEVRQGMVGGGEPYRIERVERRLVWLWGMREKAAKRMIPRCLQLKRQRSLSLKGGG